MGSVNTVSWPDWAVHDFVLTIRIQRFEGVIPDGAHLLASWKIHDPDDGRLLMPGTLDHSTPGWMTEDYSDLVKELDAALCILADDLVSELDKRHQS